jgi:hypothetical protein
VERANGKKKFIVISEKDVVQGATLKLEVF